MVARKYYGSMAWFAAMLALIGAADLTAARGPLATAEGGWLAYAVAADLMIVVPALYWGFVVRRKNGTVADVLPVIAAGGLIAWFIVPAAMKQEAVWLAPAVAAAEAAVSAYLIRKLYLFVRETKRLAAEGLPGAEALRVTVSRRLGGNPLGRYVLHDLTMYYYLFFSWGRKRAVEAEGEAYTYHRETTQILYACILTKVLLVEGVLMHLLMHQWSPAVAWALTLADVWLLLLIWADCRASATRPIRVRDAGIELRYGLRIQADIPFDAIGTIEHAREFHPDKQELKTSATPVLGTPNVKIELAAPTSVESLLFVRKEVTRIYLAVDEASAFVDAVNRRLRERTS